MQRPELMAAFKEARSAVEEYLRHDDWHLWATMTKGYVTMAVFQSLEAYWPGVLTIVGMYYSYSLYKVNIIHSLFSLVPIH